MRRPMLQTILVCSCLFFPSEACWAQADFDARYNQGLSRNPTGVKFALRTENQDLTFHLYETIPIRLEFSSVRPLKYSIEIDEVMNYATRTQVEVDPANTVSLTLDQWSSHGVICCSSDQRYLSKQPIVLNRELTDWIRFEAPGTYRVFLTTQRVFDRPRKWDYFGPSKMTLTSNILTLTILPDDSDWDARRLAECLRKLDDVRLRANYRLIQKSILAMGSEKERGETAVYHLDQTEFANARKALNALDTLDAIRERVARTGLAAKSEDGSMLWQGLLQSTTQPGILVEAMSARAEDPSFAVDDDYVYRWAQYVVLRDHPEILRLPRDDIKYQEQSHILTVNEIAAKRSIVACLEALLDSKKGKAKTITAMTIRALNEELAYETKSRNQKTAHP